MPIWGVHAGHFLARVASFAIANGGYTAFSFVFFLLLPPIWAVIQDIRRAHGEGKSWKVVANKEVAFAVFKKPVFLIWIALIAWAFGAVVYKDHQDLVSANGRLISQLRDLRNRPAPTCPAPQISTVPAAKESSPRPPSPVTSGASVVQKGNNNQSAPFTVNGGQTTNGAGSHIINGSGNNVSPRP